MWTKHILKTITTMSSTAETPYCTLKKNRNYSNDFWSGENLAENLSSLIIAAG